MTLWIVEHPDYMESVPRPLSIWDSPNSAEAEKRRLEGDPVWGVACSKYFVDLVVRPIEVNKPHDLDDEG